MTYIGKYEDWHLHKYVLNGRRRWRAMRARPWGRLDAFSKKELITKIKGAS